MGGLRFCLFAIAIVFHSTAADAYSFLLVQTVSSNSGVPGALGAVSRKANGDFSQLQPLQLIRVFEQKCLSVALYHEARGEDIEGQAAVGRVILNRVEATVYPASICGVVYQNAERFNRCQFSFACDRLPDLPRDGEALANLDRLAAVLYRADMRGGVAESDSVEKQAVDRTRKFNWATHYHATYVNPSWASKLKPLGTVGRHVFFSSSRVLKTMKKREDEQHL